jgi:hypothetical protein
MSAGNVAPEYVPMARFPAGHQVLVLHDGPVRAVDYFNTRSAAEYAARLLNAGLAHGDQHAVVGCKVVAS